MKMGKHTGANHAPKVESPAGRRSQKATPRFSTIMMVGLLAALMVAIGTIVFLSKGLPEEATGPFHYPATEFKFAFGAGEPSANMMQVNQFANGYALLSSGPVDINAEQHRVLAYTWLPSGPPGEAAFFWRRAGDTQNIVRTDITVPGSQMLDLSAEPGWQGQITEFGYLVSSKNDETVMIGESILIPDGLRTRLDLTWRAWTYFEEWSQQSINFLYGGNHRQVAPLPLLIGAWLLLTLVLLRLAFRFSKNYDPQQFLIIGGMLFMIAWILLDLRWAVNNWKQTQRSLTNLSQTGMQQQAVNELDADIWKYIQRLKMTVLGEEKARILLLGDDTAIDYYLLKAKYHLLPHSVNVAGRLTYELSPESIDFIIFFGQPENLVRIRGWSARWRDSLIRIDSGEFGLVFRTQQSSP